MDLELKKIDYWIKYLDIKIVELSKGNNVTEEILQNIRQYKAIGNPAVLACLREINLELKSKVKLKEKNVIFNIMIDFKQKSSQVSEAYDRLEKIKQNVDKSLNATINLKESLISLKAARKRFGDIRKVLSI